MSQRINFRPMPALAAFGVIGLLAMSNGCSSNDGGGGAPASCNGLDTGVQAQATIKAYGEAAGRLQAKAAEVEGKWLAVCNAMNKDLGEDSSKTTAKEA